MSAKFVQIAIPVPIRQLFTYLVPEAISAAGITIGSRLIVPFGARQVIGIALELSDECELDTSKLKSVISKVDDNYHFDSKLLTFLRSCASYYHHPLGDVLQQALPVLLRQVQQPEVSPTMQWHSAELKTAPKDIKAREDKIAALHKRAAKQASLYELIASHNGMSWPELRTLGFSKAQLNALSEKALIVEQPATIETFSWHDDCLNESDKLALNVEQSVVVSAIKQCHNAYSCHLIDGVTGSGKTEVYLQSIEEVLSQNQQVLILVPEIGLTPQTLSRFEQRFNVPIYLHHSGLNDKERLDTWLSAQRGSAGIIIGTRSAIFTPLHKLGLIIVDEEHDGSFKQQDSFRYHGRDMAILRARQLDIPILLGSATPSLETLQNALSGKYHYHQLKKRAGNSKQAKISLVDVANQPTEFGLTAPIKSAIKQTLAKNEQVLLFLNRRGYAPAVNCKECHWVADCNRCNKSYTLHQKQQLLICHHCGSQKRIPMQCPSCGSARLAPLGQGTEQLEEKIGELFEQASVVRIDRDSTRRKGALAKLLQEIADNEHQLLIGTQMLAKGHHFPNVTLVVMLDIDGALFSYDFRAAEQMAQLLVQVAGRAGRASKPGRVLVQTNFPDHPLLQDLVNNGYHHFARQSLTERQQALLPPFTFQGLLRAEANYPSYPEKFIRELTQYQFDGCELAGPIPAAMEKKAGKFRFHLLIQSKSRSQLHRGIMQLLACIEQTELQKKVRWSIDIDPVDLSW